MSVRPTPPTTSPLDRADSRIARQLTSTALIVLVLGVLPIAWGASAVWQVIGCAVSVPLAVHTARAVWREVFSSDPEHPAHG
jgi:hypothetical protein